MYCPAIGDTAAFARVGADGVRLEVAVDVASGDDRESEQAASPQSEAAARAILRMMSEDQGRVGVVTGRISGSGVVCGERQ